MKPAPHSARLLLLDTYGLIYRGFFALPPMTTPDGTPVNAVYGLVMMLNRIIIDEQPTHVIAAFDRGLPAERLSLFPSYKAQRESMPDDLRAQFPLVREVFAALDIPILEVEGQEADDVIATLARQAEELGEETFVITGDLDLLQIVDAHTTILTQRKGISDVVRYTPGAVFERFELSPSQLADYRGLKGDPSDNLPGIPGIGEKTAIKLMKAAGSLDALLANPSLAGSPRLEAAIAQFGNQARICRDVSVIRRDLPIALDWERAKYRPASNDDLYRLYSKLGFKSQLAKLSPPSEMPLFAGQPALHGEYRSYVAAVDPPDYVRLAADLEALADAPSLALALADADVLAVTAEQGKGIAFSCAALAHEQIAAALGHALSSAKSLITYDAKRIARILHGRGFGWIQPHDDAMLGAHLLDPSRTFADIADASVAVLAVTLTSEPAARADAAIRLVSAERATLGERNQLELYADVEVPSALVLAKMEEVGIRVDPHALDELRGELDARIRELTETIYAQAGETFNIGSPLQLGHVLFERLGIPGGKKNKTGWATGVEVLQSLARTFPICAQVLEWREVSKLKNTYVDVLPTLIDPRDGRLHTQFNQTATATGRLSSTNPNIPIRTEQGRRIRKAFVARNDDWVLVSADYSQIELRLMAHFSGDPAMIAAFEAGHDIHEFTARQIFAVPAELAVSDEQRRIAKMVNFGLLYGMSDFGLAQRLDIDRGPAREITQAYFARFASVRAYIDRTIEQARGDGYVQTLLGRRRYMPALSSSNHALRTAAEREATNAPLQGSAADLMKLAMVHIDAALRERGSDAEMLLQIHDEVVLDVPKAHVTDIAKLVADCMRNAYTLRVPLEVTVKSGPNLFDRSEVL
ncbi:MAG: DNA polymerase I [Vulcanimicrobiaceae bacterium]